MRGASDVFGRIAAVLLLLVAAAVMLLSVAVVALMLGQSVGIVAAVHAAPFVLTNPLWLVP